MSPPSIRCPTCQRELQWSAEFQWRPFCSERCKMVDLGAWFAEEHRISADEEGRESSPQSDSRD